MTAKVFDDFEYRRLQKARYKKDPQRIRDVFSRVFFLFYRPVCLLTVLPSV